MAQYGNNNQNFKPIPKTALNEYKLRLFGPTQEGGTRPPTLSVSLIRNQPRIDVFTNVPNDRDNGRITAAMDTFTMYALLDQVTTLTDAEPDKVVKFENRIGRPDETRIASYTYVGKDKSGVMFISVTAEGRPKIKFSFLPSLYHTIAHRDGTPYSESELSVVYARAWAESFRQILGSVLVNYYEEPEPRNPAGGGGGRTNGGSSGQSAEHQQSSSESGGDGGGGGDFGGDDLPM